MKYVVKVTETLARIVIVNADNEDDAVSKVEQAYLEDGEIVLDYRDYTGHDVSFVHIACPGDIERYEEVGVKE